MSDDVLVFLDPSLLALQEETDTEFLIFNVSETLEEIVETPGDILIIDDQDPTEVLVQYSSGAVFVLTSGGPPGAQGPPGPPGTGLVTSTGVAGQALSGHRVVVPTDDGFIYADPAEPTHAYKPMFMTMNACSDGEEIEVLALGSYQEPTWAWADGLIYLGSGGQLVQVMGAWAFCRVLAMSEAPDRLMYDPQPPIVLA